MNPFQRGNTLQYRDEIERLLLLDNILQDPKNTMSYNPSQTRYKLMTPRIPFSVTYRIELYYLNDTVFPLSYREEHLAPQWLRQDTQRQLQAEHLQAIFSYLAYSSTIRLKTM